MWRHEDVGRRLCCELCTVELTKGAWRHPERVEWRQLEQFPEPREACVRDRFPELLAVSSEGITPAAAYSCERGESVRRAEQARDLDEDFGW